MPMELETERLTLRPRAQADTEDYRALVAERDAEPVPAEIMRERIAAQRASSAQAGIGLLSVIRRAEGDFIGYCGLWSTVRRWNAPSLRVLEKTGFHRDHVDPDPDGRGDLIWLTRALP